MSEVFLVPQVVVSPYFSSSSPNNDVPYVRIMKEARAAAIYCRHTYITASTGQDTPREIEIGLGPLRLKPFSYCQGNPFCGCHWLTYSATLVCLGRNGDGIQGSPADHRKKDTLAWVWDDDANARARTYQRQLQRQRQSHSKDKPELTVVPPSWHGSRPSPIHPLSLHSRLSSDVPLSRS